jgi:hypothetical protein
MAGRSASHRGCVLRATSYELEKRHDVDQKPPGPGAGLQEFVALVRDLARASFAPVLVVLIAFVAAFVASIAAGALVIVSEGLAGPTPRHVANEEAIGRSIGFLVAGVFFSVFAVACGLGGFIVHRRRKRRKHGAEE